VLREVRRQVSFFFRNIRNFFLSLQGVEIGKNVFVSYGAWIDVQDGKVVLEDGVRVTKGVKILSHDASAWITSNGEGVSKVTVIGEGAFIGMNAVVLPGVNVGKDAIVGAGCIVAKDVPDGAVVVGQGVRIIKMKNPVTGQYEDVRRSDNLLKKTV